MHDSVMSTKVLRGATLATLIAMLVALPGCGSKEAETPVAATPAAADVAQAVPVAAPADAAAAAQTLVPTATTWTPEAMEELLAPVALYPDVVLGQVLVASTNPQEVLDAGNWLLQNQTLQGNALDEAAKQAGFTPPIRGLLQSPEVVDMMCSQMGWTEELGQAFVNDQQGVLDAVQRLRAQAKDVGNLQSSEQLKVATETQDGHEVITVSPPSPQVVYVPQYDPVAVYAPPPATVPTPPAPVVQEDKGHSTTALVTTGLLSFGAGILVANVFDDDDDDYYRNGYYNPRYYGPPMPYHPPYPYRPRYGNGYYPNSNYNRPPNYQHSFNNNTIVINQNSNNDYWNRHDPKSGVQRDSRSAKSPITAAKPNRPELNSLNAQAKQGPQRPAPTQADWKGQSGYAGAQKSATDKVAGAKPAASSAGSRDLPKVQGSYAGATPAGSASNRVASAAQDKKPAAKPAAAKPAAAKSVAAKPAAASTSRPAAVPAAKAIPAGATDRGYSKPASAASTKAAAAPERARPTAVSRSDRGAADKAASQRGKQSMPSGVPAKAKTPSKPTKR
jgi:hypothetical protein